MILIADSGSTKTHWALLHENKVRAEIRSQGINPFFQDNERIRQIVKMELAYPLRSQGTEPEQLTEIHFYGAGLRDEMKGRVVDVLQRIFPNAAIEAQADLLAAARALCGHDEGIACILGTGSNSGLYDGTHIVANIPPLGYILGDEGSGAVLGKLFLGSLLKGLIPNDVKEEYLSDTGESVADIIDKVYRQPLPNRYLAHAAKFIHRHIERPELHQLVVDNFRAFLQRNVAQYQRPDLAVNAVGSIALYFKDQWHEALDMERLIPGTILQAPIQGLVNYHLG
ncbi:MAG: ATPase [Prevotella sp.]|nr:ATPase [Prevotella sp.]